MEKWTRFTVSAICLIIVALIFPNHIFAAENLDEHFKDFSRNYHKEETLKSRLASFKETSEIYDRRMIVKVKEGTTLNISSLSVELVKGMHALKGERLYVVQVPPNIDYEKKLQELARIKNVIHVEPDFVIENIAINQPTDVLFKEQWYLEKIDLLQAWQMNSGSSDVTIAVIDSGVNANHPDLKGRVLQGYDFVHQKSNGHGDDHGHGTHVAGIIAANVNTIGITGIDQEANILPIKAMSKDGTGSISAAIDAVYYAMEQDADVINMSYVTDQYSKLEEEALLAAHEQGIVLVAAAGNNNSDAQIYPGSYDHVINVAATNKYDQKANFSNYGLWIDMTAPGEKIYSTNFSGGYDVDSGTSFSAPIVSAIAGLIKAEHPNWNAQQIRWALEYGADTLNGTEWDHYFGYGRANAYESLQAVLPSMENDAGNGSAQATQLISDQTVIDHLDLPADKDWFTFHVEHATELNIDVTNESVHADLVGVLYRYDGNTIQEQYVLDDYGMGEHEQAVLDIEEGTYYLVMYEYYGRWSEDPYQLHLQFDSADNQTKLFSDVSIYQTEIEALANAGIIQGYPDRTFKPRYDVKRVQAVTMLLREMGIDVNGYDAPDPGFRDVQSHHEGYKEIAAAVDLGIITGRKDNTFAPWDSLTRAQMAAILVRAFDLEGSSSKVQFTDVPAHHWAYEEIHTLVVNDIAQGYPDQTFKPYVPISRQHFALLLYNKRNAE